MAKIWEAFINANECDKTIVDIYDRVPNSVNSNNIFVPNVSQFLIGKGFKPEYPGGKKFAVAISHDVDILEKDDVQMAPTKHFGGVKSAAGLLINELRNSVKRASGKKTKSFIPWDMKEFAGIEKKYKIPATYYFLSLLPGETDFNYHVKEIAHIFEMVKNAGGEIGLHGGHEAYASANKIAQEKKLLEDACGVKLVGYRNHYLRFDRNTTWRALETNGFFYDTTYGDPHSPGFRNGMCHPFFPYDIKTKSFIPVIEIPLIYMDKSPTRYMNIDEAHAWTLFCDLVEKVKAVNGVFTFLWHNNFMNKKQHAFYVRAVEHLRSLDPWFATGNEIAKHYSEKNYLEEIKTILSDGAHGNRA
ncbi:MAG: polysaccharide deacetylase family protein [Bacteroidota bacterium]